MYSNDSFKAVVQDAKPPQFTHDQVVFIAKWIMAAAFDRMESNLPDTIHLDEYLANKHGCDCMIVAAKDTAAMSLAIFFAQTTGEGMGVWDWAGSKEFAEACASFINTRTDPEWRGLKVGEPCYPDTEPFAKLFADEWWDTINSNMLQSRG